MAAKEASARIRINQLLAQAGWRFFAENGKPANIALESKMQSDAIVLYVKTVYSTP